MRSRVVAWLRVLLPLAALAILSTLFLLPNAPDPDAAIPYADVDAEALARDPRMTQPRFSGVAKDGAAVTLIAETASPTEGHDANAERLRMTWRAADGLAADLTAPYGALEGVMIRLNGGVRVTTSNGWAMTVPVLITDTESGLMIGEGGMTAFAPFGRVDAERMEIARNADGQHVLNLSGGVRLLYQP